MEGGLDCPLLSSEAVNVCFIKRERERKGGMRERECPKTHGLELGSTEGGGAWDMASIFEKDKNIYFIGEKGGRDEKRVERELETGGG